LTITGETAVTGTGAPAVGDPPGSVIPVAAHTRRAGASARATALAHAILAFVRQGGAVDQAAVEELERARAELDAYLARQHGREGS
jgi:hypothetical protein